MGSSTDVLMQMRTDTLRQRCKWLTLAIAALWLLATCPAEHYFGFEGIEAAAVSAASSLVAGLLTCWLASRVSEPRKQAFAVLLGTAIRGLSALLSVVVMQYALRLSLENYLIWL